MEFYIPDPEPDNGKRFNQDLKLSRKVDLDGKWRNFFFWSDMLVAIGKE